MKFGDKDIFCIFSYDMYGVGRFRERQYQLAAQRHNEEFLKYDYYQQTAKYFERVCKNAKYYDSWNYKSLDPKGELEKRKKAERLLARRSRLKSLLKEEEETYKREIEERKRVQKIRPEESSSEFFVEKLKQRRTESLCYPKTCRRYQSYFVCPKEPADSRWNTLKDTNLQYSRVCRDTTNFINQNERNSYRRYCRMSETDSKSSKQQENQEKQREISSCPSSNYLDELARCNPKFSARYARRSLENTNVRNDDCVDYVPSRAMSRSSVSFGSSSGRHVALDDETPVHGDNKENHKDDVRLSSSQDDRSGSAGSADDRSIGSRDPVQRADSSEKSPTSGEAAAIQLRASSAKQEQDALDVQKKGNRQFEVEKSLPWLRMNPGDKNLSKQMFLYLTHKELKCKIEDLAKRESHACNKQYWDEALRLRDMRNRLELIREKQLYNIENLDVDEDTRKIGMINITKREKELTEREHLCMDSTMYSEDAKALWKKWVHEDASFTIEDARMQRENLMSTLEAEWQNLAIRDKEKISQSYQNEVKNSTVQEERKLSATINAARMKSVSSSMK